MKRCYLILSLAVILVACSPAATEEETTMGNVTDNVQHTFVLVHGASGGGWDWQTVDKLLSAEGHTVYRPTLTGLGERVHLTSPDIDLTTHINDIANVILFEDLHNVVLVGHSYGGMVITGVMNKIPERIRHAIFLDANVPLDGMSAQDLWGDVPRNHRVEDGIVYFSWLPETLTTPGDVPQSFKTLTEPVAFDNPAAIKLPTTLIAYLESGTSVEQRSADPSWQHAEARGWTVLTLQSDHNAQRSHPEELVELLLDRANSGS